MLVKIKTTYTKMATVFLVGFCSLVAFLLYIYLVHTPPIIVPVLTGAYHESDVVVSDRVRSYASYVPKNVEANARLVFVLHGSLQTITDIRKYTGYEFERLADQHGFIVVYPQGYKNNWNDCRKTASYPARAENIDDVSFIHKLIEQFSDQYAINLDQVFLVGFSNGAHLGFRFALEQPGTMAGVAAISANVPTSRNLDCQVLRAETKSSSILIMNGTQDPINPYNGGKVSLWGFGDRGNVLSSLASSIYFANLAGYATGSVKHVTVLQKDNLTREPVTLAHWQDEGLPEVALYTIYGGGHVVPQPHFIAPGILGVTAAEFNGPETIWSFFSRQNR